MLFALISFVDLSFGVFLFSSCGACVKCVLIPCISCIRVEYVLMKTWSFVTLFFRSRSCFACLARRRHRGIETCLVGFIPVCYSWILLWSDSRQISSRGELHLQSIFFLSSLLGGRENISISLRLSKTSPRYRAASSWLVEVPGVCVTTLAASPSVS